MQELILTTVMIDLTGKKICSKLLESKALFRSTKTDQGLLTTRWYPHRITMELTTLSDDLHSNNKEPVPTTPLITTLDPSRSNSHKL
jgi:hypothetical protein